MTGFLRGFLRAILVIPAWLLKLAESLCFQGGVVVHVDLPRLQEGREDNLGQLLEMLDRVRADPLVKALHLTLHGTAGGWGRLQEIRHSLIQLGKAGKPLFVDLANVSNTDLFLASAARRVFIVPSGQVHAAGLAARMNFFGEALKRLGIRVQLITAGEYKAAGEPMTRAHPSPESRHAIQELVEDLHDQLVQAVASGRNLDPELVREAMEQTPLSAEQALESGLVDELVYPDQFRAAMERALGRLPRIVSMGGYLFWSRLAFLPRRLAGYDGTVAVVHLQGPVVMRSRAGPSRSLISADEVVPVLDALQDDRHVAGIVLSIDSGGGSALASDLIWRAIHRLRQQKPVLAVLRNIAASGGYYMAVGADEVYAQPGSITGSIGVISGKLVLDRALSRLGVFPATLRASGSADMESAGRALTEPELLRQQKSVQQVYDTFLRRVADGRRRPLRAVIPYAAGRVWTGRRARDAGLVDGFTTLHDAWRRVCRISGLPDDPCLTRRLHIRPGHVARWKRLLRGILPGVRSEDTLARILEKLVEPESGRDLLLLAELLVDSPTQPLALMEWRPNLDGT